MTLDWLDEEAPPRPQGMIAFGEMAHSLLARVAPVAAAAGVPRPAWRATAHRHALVVLGEADTLPWLDGARYIAPRPEAPLLWLPTERRPSLPLDLLWLAVMRRHARSPLLMWPSPAQLIPLDRARTLDVALLNRIRARWDTA